MVDVYQWYTCTYSAMVPMVPCISVYHMVHVYQWYVVLYHGTMVHVGIALPVVVHVYVPWCAYVYNAWSIPR
jgi:hypothetical protein